MDYNFEVSEQGVQPVLSVRTRTSVGNLPQELGKAYTSIIAYLSEIGEQPADAAFAAYYNMDMEDLDVEMGFPVTRVITGKEEIKPGEIPAGKRVSAMHKGPYMEMEPLYNAMTEWMNTNGHIPLGICYEFYYNSPMEVPEAELLTKVVFLVK